MARFKPQQAQQPVEYKPDLSGVPGVIEHFRRTGRALRLTDDGRIYCDPPGLTGEESAALAALDAALVSHLSPRTPKEQSNADQPSAGADVQDRPIDG